ATIERNAKIQAQLVEDILDASRLVAGEMNVQSQPVNLGQVVRVLANSFQPTAAAKGVTLTAEVAPEPVLVAGDPDRLQQVAWHVLANALKFTPAGGRVDVSLHTEDDQAVLKVADTGVGIPG